MRKISVLFVLTCMLFIGCTTDEVTPVGSGVYCTSDQNCKDSAELDQSFAWYCDKTAKECKRKGGSTAPDDESAESEKPDIKKDIDSKTDGGNTDESPDYDLAGKDCAPGQTQKCAYTGLSGTEDVGACKAGVKTCKSDGTWGSTCNGEVKPIYEICGNGIDEDCSGKADDGDIDGDGIGYCDSPADCCERETDCPDPKSVHPGAEEVPNGIDDNCNGQVDDGAYDCDASLNAGTKDPMDYARAIGLCKTTTENGTDWGVISVNITQPDGSKVPNVNSNGLLNALGNVIKPKVGSYMLALTSGKVGNPLPETSFSQSTSSAPPGDWYAANGNKYPSSPSCGGSTGTTGNTNDGVMVKIRMRAPMSANSFSFSLYFLTIEYPNYICSKFNDFFVALLDSKYTSTDPNLQNPADKNLGRDSLGNPVGINIAPAGLFKQCVNQPSKGVTSCVGTEELQGTGFQNSGGTGWLVTRGNVVPGEVIELRLSIWDLGDNALDSMVLIDNFQWSNKEFKPGTGESY